MQRTNNDEQLLPMKITLSNRPNQTFSPTTQALNAIISLAAALVLASCASPPRTAIHTPLAPQVASEEHDGFLKVYSASAWTSDHDDGGSVIYTDYQIHSPAGTLFREV